MFTLNIEKKTLSEGGTPTKSKLGVGGDPYTFCRGGVRPQGANKSGMALRNSYKLTIVMFCKLTPLPKTVCNFMRILEKYPYIGLFTCTMTTLNV